MAKSKAVARKLNRSIRDAVKMAFDELQKDSNVNLIEWGRNNPTAFYALASKLIPLQTEVAGRDGIESIKIEFVSPVVQPSSNEPS